eukprot:SAG31_NODE_37278_length_305_cov_1.504854_1_plen_81_part_01
MPAEQFAFAVFGWTGSRQFNRFVRDYARRVRGLSLSSQAAVTIGPSTDAVHGATDFMVVVPSKTKEGERFWVHSPLPPRLY